MVGRMRKPDASAYACGLDLSAELEYRGKPPPTKIDSGERHTSSHIIMSLLRTDYHPSQYAVASFDTTVIGIVNVRVKAGSTSCMKYASIIILRIIYHQYYRVLAYHLQYNMCSLLCANCIS